MGTEPPKVLEDDELNDTDREILDLLHDGRVSPPYVRDEIGVSREYASERLIRLREHDHVERIAPGLYELVDDPRADETADEPDETLAEVRAERDVLRETVAELRRLSDDESVLRIDRDDAKDWLIYADRALSELPEDVPGRNNVEDLRAELERAIREAEDDG